MKAIEMGGACSTQGGDEVKNVHKILVRRPEGKSPFGITRCRMKGNISVS
jgi:hypothetical protein